MSKFNRRPATVVVSVTYASRHSMCLQMMDRAFENGADRLILVCNGVAAESAEAIQSAACGDDRIEIIWFERNLGTAAAFAAGIARALELNPTHVWILDDDNLAEPNCLQRAVALLERLQSPANPFGVLVSCFRDTDEEHMRIVREIKGKTRIAPAGGIFGVDVLSRLTQRRDDSVTAGFSHYLTQAPYGGLVARADLFRAVGPPRADFVLYFDDVELTRRIRSAGIPIVLGVSSIIIDSGSKWVESATHSYLRGMILARNKVRTYYTYRNSFVLDWAQACTSGSRLRFSFNFVVYSAYVFFTAGKLCDLSYFWVYLKACRDAIFHRMGERMELQ